MGDASSLFYGKVDTDVEFYQQLMVLFQGKGLFGIL